ncbi:MAG: type II toxin-antitoxin system RelE/ParE family toxin [Gemmatimonadaceae bacterium]
MTPRLFVRRAAKTDVAAAFQWYEAHRAGLGDAFAEEVGRTYAAIEEHPHQFPVMLDDIRMALVHRFPYVIYFVSLPRHISIIAVLHGHRNPRALQQRR